MTDEGIYMLSYTQPKAYTLTCSGYHHFVTPLMSIAGSSVISMRFLRLGLLFAANLLFSWAFYKWLRWAWASGHAQLRPLIFPFLLLGLPASYLWAPQSLGYNDLVAVGVLCAISAGLCAIVEINAVKKINAIACFALIASGLCVSFVAIVKISAAPGVTLLIGGLIFHQLGTSGTKVRCNSLLILTIGFCAGLVLIHISCINLFAFWEQFVEGARIATHSSHNPNHLIAGYLQQVWDSLEILLRYFGWSFAILFLLPEILSRRRHIRRKAEAWIFMGAMVIGILSIATKLNYFRGAHHTDSAVQGWWLIIILIGILASSSWWRRRLILIRRPGWVSHFSNSWPPTKSWFVLVVLALLPFAASVGTSSRFLYPMVYLASTWFACLMFLTGWALGQRLVRPGVVLCLGLFLSLVLAQFSYGYLHRPYRLAMSLSKQTETVEDLPNGRELQFDPPTAELLRALLQAFQKNQMKPQCQILASYDLSGLVYLLGGTSPALYGAYLDLLISEQKEGGDFPILLLTDHNNSAILTALERMGGNLVQDYRMAASVTVPLENQSLTLWIPKEKPVEQ